MAERMNVTTAEHTTAAWIPRGFETMLQIEAVAPGVKVAVEVRVDESASWVEVAKLSAWPDEQDRVVRLPLFPSMRLVMTGNSPGAAVKVWGTE